MGERIETERAADRVILASAGPREGKEPWEALLSRIDLAEPAAVSPRDMKRVLADMWTASVAERHATALIDEAIRRDRKSLDRILISSYLRDLPDRHPGFDHLRRACARVAERHEWAWRERAVRWELWDKEAGPRRLARALLTADDPADVMRQAGLSGDLATGRFALHALTTACVEASTSSGVGAEETGRRLITLFQPFAETSAVNGLLAFALLVPWVGSACSDQHRRMVGGLLTARMGDPRLNRLTWSALRAEVVDMIPGADVEAAFSVLRRWLVNATMREFFSVVAKTVDRKDQWRERTAFWMAYVDAELITDAWFAFGPVAERAARNLIEDRSVNFATHTGTGASGSQSALVFDLGELRVAEWSDNGRCRFWRAQDPCAPELYEKVYNTSVLKTSQGGTDFRAISHNPPNGWQPKFAHHVYKMTGIPHPTHGYGW